MKFFLQNEIIIYLKFLLYMYPILLIKLTGFLYGKIFIILMSYILLGSAILAFLRCNVISEFGGCI